MLKPLALALALSSTVALATPSEPTTPILTQEEVTTAFGENLEMAPRAEALLMLAVAMDATTPSSPFADQQIGIPFITSERMGYWVMLFQQGDRRVETLVNNALIVLFMHDPAIPLSKRQPAAATLLSLAAKQGYWPAKAYLAERHFEQMQQQLDTPLMPAMSAENQRGQIFADLQACAQVGFAPCHYKLGFWYLAGGQVEAALPMLQAGVELVRRDRRYLSDKATLEDTVDSLKILVDERAPITVGERTQYQQILEGFEAQVDAAS